MLRPPAPTDDAAVLLRRRLNAMPRDLDRERKMRRLVGPLGRRLWTIGRAIVEAERVRAFTSPR